MTNAQFKSMLAATFVLAACLALAPLAGCSSDGNEDDAGSGEASIVQMDAETEEDEGATESAESAESEQDDDAFADSPDEDDVAAEEYIEDEGAADAEDEGVEDDGAVSITTYDTETGQTSTETFTYDPADTGADSQTTSSEGVAAE